MCSSDLVQFFVKLFSRGAFGIAGREVLTIYRVHPGGHSRSAKYYFEGIRAIRRAEAAGEFAAFIGQDRDDLRAYLAMLGRVAAVRQISGAARMNGAKLYASEFRHQLRQGRARFLLGYPMTLALRRRGSSKDER